MPDPDRPLSLSPAWALLLLIPVALFAGRWLADLPVAASKPLPAEATSVREPVRAPSVPRAMPAPADAPEVEAPRGHETPPPVRSEWTTLSSAMAESERTGKPILLDFNAEWCPPCQALRREVFEDGARARAVEEAVIPVSVVDRTREDGMNTPEIAGLQARYQVEGFPTLVVFHPATGRAERATGFGDADQSLAWITWAAQAVR